MLDLQALGFTATALQYGPQHARPFGQSAALRSQQHLVTTLKLCSTVRFHCDYKQHRSDSMRWPLVSI
jgi:hypothetical protein